jgi:DNA mismatch repair protein MutH
MEGFDDASRDSILAYAKQLEGKSLSEIDLPARREISLGKGKGSFGLFVEYYVFGVKPNSNPFPDLPKAKVEIKTAPLICAKRVGVTPKERMVLGIIDFNGIVGEQFESSKFMQKNECLLALFYFWRANAKPRSLRFERVEYIVFRDEDREIIKSDWEAIRAKVSVGEAHLLSEGDTLYLGACTKGVNSKTLRRQPFGKAPARQRAFSLKTSYLKNYRNRSKNIVDIAPQLRPVSPTASFEELVVMRLAQFKGKSEAELVSTLAPAFSRKKPKHLFRLLVDRMLGLKEKQRAGEFEKANLTIRAIRVEEDGDIEQSMSFKNIDYDELVDTKTWEDSEFYDEISRRFLLCVFKRSPADGEFRFVGGRFWGMPAKDLEDAKRVWSLTRRLTKSGDEAKFPKSSETKVAHVRPKAQKGHHTVNFRGRRIKKKCFWFNREYVTRVVHRLFCGEL